MKKILISILFIFSTQAYALDEIASSCEFNHINYKQAVAFVNILKSEIQKNNKQTIAAMATYPITINEIIKVKGKDETRQHTIKDKTQFLKDYDVIFTSNMKTAIIEDPEPIFCNYQGAMIAHGIIWFNTENDKAAFFAVNRE